MFDCDTRILIYSLEHKLLMNEYQCRINDRRSNELHPTVIGNPGLLNFVLFVEFQTLIRKYRVLDLATPRCLV